MRHSQQVLCVEVSSVSWLGQLTEGVQITDYFNCWGSKFLLLLGLGCLSWISNHWWGEKFVHWVVLSCDDIIDSPWSFYAPWLSRDDWGRYRTLFPFSTYFLEKVDWSLPASLAIWLNPAPWVAVNIINNQGYNNLTVIKSYHYLVTFHNDFTHNW